MNPKDLLLQIGSVTVAATALVGGNPACAEISQAARTATDAAIARREPERRTQSRKLVFTPVAQGILLASHRSHSSHRSHQSHYSGSSGRTHYSGSGGYSSPTYRSPSVPAAPTYRGPTLPPRTGTPPRTGPSVQPGLPVPPLDPSSEPSGVVTREGHPPGPRLHGAKLPKWDLTHGSLVNADLGEAVLTEALLVRADLEDADLTKADLTGAIMSGANLKNAKLVKATLKHADLHGANLCWANLEDADLEGVDLTHALYNKYTQWPKGFDPKAHKMHLLDSE